MPQPKRRQRRVNPHKAPWDTLPVIVFHPDPNHVEAPMTHGDWDRVLDLMNDPTFDPTELQADRPAIRDGELVPVRGEVVVTRGPFDLNTPPERCLDQMVEHPGEEYVVETDGLGRIDVARRGALTDAHLADIGVENTGHLEPLQAPNAAKYDTLAEYAQALREHAARTVELANTYDQLVSHGWDLAPTPPPSASWPPLRRTTTGHNPS